MNEDSVGAIGQSRTECDLCREQVPDARPFPVHGRSFIPAICDTCFVTLKREGRLDLLRNREVFYPDDF